MMAIPGFNGTLPIAGTGSAEQQPDQDNQIATEFAALLAASCVLPAASVPIQEAPATNDAGANPVSQDSQCEGNSPVDSRQAKAGGSDAPAAGTESGFDIPAIPAPTSDGIQPPAPDRSEIATRGLGGFASLFERSARVPTSIPTSADSAVPGAVAGVAGRSLRGFASLFARTDRNQEPVPSNSTSVSAGVEATNPPLDPSAVGIVVEAKEKPARTETGVDQAISFRRLPMPDRNDTAVPQVGDRLLAAEIFNVSSTSRPSETVERTITKRQTAIPPQDGDPVALPGAPARVDNGGQRKGSLLSIDNETTAKVDDAAQLSPPAASLRSEDSASISARVIDTIRNATSTVLLRGNIDQQDQSSSVEPMVNERAVPPTSARDSLAPSTARVDGPAEVTDSGKGSVEKAESESVERVAPDSYVVSSTKRQLAEQRQNQRSISEQRRPIATVSQPPPTKDTRIFAPNPMSEVVRAGSKVEEQADIDQNAAVTHTTSDGEDNALTNRSLNLATAGPIGSKQPGRSLPGIGSIAANAERTETSGRVTTGMTVESVRTVASGFDAPSHETSQAALHDTEAAMPKPENADRVQLKEHLGPGPIQLVQEGLSAKFPEGIKITGDVQQVARQVAEPTLEAAEGLRRNETKSIKISLRPDELGRVEVEVRRDVNGHVSAVLTADRAESAQLLADGMNGLRQHLEQAGVTVDRLDIYTAQQFQSPGNQSSNSNNPQNSQQEGARNPEYMSANQPNSDGQAAIEEERLLNILA